MRAFAVKLLGMNGRNTIHNSVWSFSIHYITRPVWLTAQPTDSYTVLYSHLTTTYTYQQLTNVTY